MRASGRPLIAVIILGATIGAGVAGGPPASAATVVVTTTADGGAGSLRAAIDAANLATTATTIALPAGTYPLDQCAVISDDTNAAGDLDLTTDQNVTILGTGGPVTVHQTCAGERVLDAQGAGAVTLTAVTVSGGSVTGTDPAVTATGGGLRVRGSLTLDHATVSNNSVTGAPGQASTFAGTPVGAGAARGGGAWVGGALTLTSAVVTDNHARGGSGANAPDGNLPYNGGKSSAGGDAEGGGIYVVGAVSAVAGSLSQNDAVGGAGGTVAGQFVQQAPPPAGGLGRGGGLAQERSLLFPSVTLTGTALTANRATGGHAGDVDRGGQSGSYLPDPPSPAAGAATGGAIASRGSLLVEGSMVSDNVATGGDAGLTGCVWAGTPGRCVGGAPAGAARGGALSGDAAVHVHAGTYARNQAKAGNSLIYAFGEVPVVHGGPAAPATGGAVFAAGPFEAATATFSTNAAVAGTGLPQQLASGGAVQAPTVTVTGGSFEANTSSNGGAIGGAAVQVSATAVHANVAEVRGGGIDATGSASVQMSTLTDNHANGTGGGAMSAGADATITDSTIERNVVEAASLVNTPGITLQIATGAGVRVAGALTIARSTVSGNRGQDRGNYPGLGGDINVGFQGTGIWAGSVAGDAVTVADNEATASWPNLGGGIFTSGAVSLVNSTVTGNVTAHEALGAATPNQGAAIAAASLSLEQTTVDANAGAEALHAGHLTLQRTVVATDGSVPACGAGTILDASQYGWATDTSCGLVNPTDHEGPAALLLGPVADNGGPVPTQLPAAASALLDQIPPASCPVPVDARGVARPHGAACDVGAVEAAAVPGTGPTDLAVGLASGTDPLVAGTTSVWSATVSNHGPNGSVPAIVLTFPAGTQVVSAVPPAGAACAVATQVVTCVWSAPLAAGTDAVVAVTGRVDSALHAPVTVSARVSAPGLTPPTGDDTASSTTTVVGSADLQLLVTNHGDLGFDAAVRNAGPSDASGGGGQPIRVTFVPAPGVHVVTAQNILLPSNQTLPITGTPTEMALLATFPPGPDPFARLFVQVSVDDPATTLLGHLHLDPGAVADPDLAGHDVDVYAADVGVTLTRSADTIPAGTPVPYTMTVTNHGPATVSGVTATLKSYVISAAGTPSAGSASFGHDPAYAPLPMITWTLPSLAPGQSETLTGLTDSSGGGGLGYGAVTGPFVDPNGANNEAEVELGPAPVGTTALGITSLEILPASDPTQRIVRFVVANHGPVATVAGMNSFVRAMFGVTPIQTVVSDPDWSCTTQCVRTTPFAAGATTTFELLLAATALDQAGSVTVRLDHGGPTIDPDLSDNTASILAGSPLVDPVAIHDVTTTVDPTHTQVVRHIDNTSGFPAVAPDPQTLIAPTGMTVEAVTADGWVCDPPAVDQSVTCHVAPAAPAAAVASQAAVPAGPPLLPEHAATSITVSYTSVVIPPTTTTTTSAVPTTTTSTVAPTTTTSTVATTTSKVAPASTTSTAAPGSSTSATAPTSSTTSSTRVGGAVDPAATDPAAAVAGVSASSTGSLPTTGSDARTLASFAGLLVLVGALVAAVTGRRRT